MVAYAEGKSNALIMNLKVRFTGDTVKQGYMCLHWTWAVVSSSPPSEWHHLPCSIANQLAITVPYLVIFEYKWVLLLLPAEKDQEEFVVCWCFRSLIVPESRLSKWDPDINYCEWLQRRWQNPSSARSVRRRSDFSAHFQKRSAHAWRGFARRSQRFPWGRFSLQRNDALASFVPI